jgi:hypothetical protein
MNDIELGLKLAAGGAVSIALSMVVVRISNRPADSIQATMPVAPFFVSVTAIFSLILAFHAATIWGRQDRAEAALLHARTNLQRLEAFSRQDLLNRPELAAAVLRYAGLVREREWATKFNTSASPEVDEALQRLRVEVIAAGGTTTGPVQSHLLHLLDEVVKARSERLWIGSQSPNFAVWFGIFALGFLSNVALAMVHQDRPRASLRALVLFNVAVCVAYWLLLRAENPYEVGKLLSASLL